MNIIFDFLSYGFIQRAYLAGSLIAITCSVLGVFLVLRKLSLIGDGLSHASLGGIALGLLLGINPLFTAIPLTIIASFLILKLIKKTKIYGDAAIGILSALGISSGVIIASKAGGFNTDLISFLFGNILAISKIEVYLAVSLSLIVIFLIWFFYWELFSITFDEDGAMTSGINTKQINRLLFFLTAIVTVLAVKIVGVMLVSSLFILPAVSALQIAKGFFKTLLFSAGIGTISVISGITIAFHADLPPGATIILINLALFLILATLKKRK